MSKTSHQPNGTPNKNGKVSWVTVIGAIAAVATIATSAIAVIEFFYKIPIYGILALTFIIISVAWLYMMARLIWDVFRHDSSIFSKSKSIAFVIIGTLLMTPSGVLAA